ncbi:MAG: transcriptional repressor [Planctomycetes bacterium]|nr:transcriptional repressor [Planctomycetota bacterium]MBM4085818.1 transcriptional repressor [Planctomycetota bacterium]
MASHETKEERFEQFLKRRGLKLTAEREAILARAFAKHRHFEAEDLLFEMRQGGSRVSKATIYRTLPLLVKCGLLREVIHGEKHAHYEHVFGHGHHDHMVCVQCGRVIEFSSQELERIQNRLCRRFGFEAESHRMQISGSCAKCSGTMRKSKAKR